MQKGKRLQAHKFVTVTLALLGILALSSCTDRSGLESTWHTYQARIGNLLDEAVEDPHPTPMPIMPRSGEMRLEIERFSINLLDSFRLDRCRLGQVVAQRNSALGKVQSITARLHYELDSLIAIEECLATEVAADPRIAAMLKAAQAHKHETLPLYIDQVLTRSDEFRHSLRAANETHSVVEAAGFEETLAALTYLDSIMSTALSSERITDIDLAPYNRHMQTLAQSNFLPRHWRTMQQNAAWLDRLNDMLVDGGDKIGCRPPSIPQRAEYLYNVMLSIFAGEIQPVLARWASYHNEIAPVLESLRDKSVQGEWHAYVDELIAEGSHADQVAQYTLRHAHLWQEVLAQCQMQPGVH